MSGSVELAADGAHLLIRFPYREDLVAMVKDLPGRRWDPKQKVWSVPAEHVEKVYAACSRHLFEFAPEVPSLLAGTLRPAAAAEVPSTPSRRAPSPTPAPADGAPAALTVSALNATVRDTLRRQFAEALWVSGEIVDFDKSAGREHRFFQLVEKARGEARPFAAVNVALFGSVAERLLPALATHEPPLELRDGLEVRLLVRIDLWSATGNYQVVVQDIDPDFTLGKLALGKEQILRELVRLGLAARNRSLGFPVPTLRIGVLTSPDADGWNDFLRHVEEAGVGLDLALFPIKVQGRDLRPSLLAGLQWFAANAEQFDLLCIVRGGGSRGDLAWFDDRQVALAVARHPLKVVVGIGHQRDQSVLDAIAHSEKTPTAVAELLVRGVQSLRDHVRELGERLLAATADQLETATRDLVATATAVARGSERRLARARTSLGTAGHRLATQARHRLTTEASRLVRTSDRVAGAATRRLDLAAAGIERAATTLRLLDPQQVLARGYTLVLGDDGRVRPSIAGVSTNASVCIRWRDGAADARIDRIHQDPR